MHLRTIVVTVLALIGGFYAGIVLSELIGIVGFLLFDRGVGIRFLPIILALASAGAALAVDTWVWSRAKPVPYAIPAPTGRSRVPLVLAGCAGLVLCAMLACAANAGYYWLYGWRNAGAGRESSPEAVRAELESLPAGAAGGGEQVFTGEGGCTSCHSLEPDARSVGPSLSGIASRAATLKPAYSAEMHIFESIVNPNAHVADDFRGGIMPADFRQRLDDQQIADLVAFLMTK